VLVNVAELVKDEEPAAPIIPTAIRLQSLNLYEGLLGNAFKPTPLNLAFESFFLMAYQKLVMSGGYLLRSQHQFQHEIVEGRPEILQTVSNQQRDDRRDWSCLRTQGANNCIGPHVFHSIAGFAVKVPRELSFEDLEMLIGPMDFESHIIKWSHSRSLAHFLPPIFQTATLPTHILCYDSTGLAPMREIMHFPSLGPKEGRYDRAFVRWCRRRRHLCVRTVELFWFLRYRHRGSPPTFSVQAARKDWEKRKWERKCLLAARKEGFWFVARADPAHGVSAVRLCSVHSKKQLAEYIAHHHGPGTWRRYHRASRTYFRKELARYQRVSGFWKACGSKIRTDFLRCMHYSNRIPEAHPDYLVRFRTEFASTPAYGFVEVKGPRESLRPSQKRFFPELATKAGQCVWVARVESANRVRFAWFNSRGELEPWPWAL